ncbi:MAG: DUF1284 domain-containing protein [Alphaproteobacteria bacterium]|uniref:DUF1284 domain-containing protein n=1 Tax=Candidatus Nitrobium versatile TaxID=2884831 RepID=A0A953JB35_9BACT|nr:DUF1284 domain-containing protein [Candidatus Nitrobium versatile]
MKNLHHKRRRLRGHHLVCLHFYSGEGYNAAFVENLEGVLSAVEQGGVEAVLGADAVCAQCPSLDNDRCSHSEQADTEIRKMDEKALELLRVRPGETLDWREIRGRIPGIFPLWHNAFCIACGWKGACDRNEQYRRMSTPLPRQSGPHGK